MAGVLAEFDLTDGWDRHPGRSRDGVALRMYFPCEPSVSSLTVSRVVSTSVGQVRMKRTRAGLHLSADLARVRRDDVEVNCCVVDSLLAGLGAAQPARHCELASGLIPSEYVGVIVGDFEPFEPWGGVALGPSSVEPPVDAVDESWCLAAPVCETRWQFRFGADSQCAPAWLAPYNNWLAESHLGAVVAALRHSRGLNFGPRSSLTAAGVRSLVELEVVGPPQACELRRAVVSDTVKQGPTTGARWTRSIRRSEARLRLGLLADDAAMASSAFLARMMSLELGRVSIDEATTSVLSAWDETLASGADPAHAAATLDVSCRHVAERNA